MADITSAAPTATSSIASTLTAPFRAIGRGLIALAEAGPRAAQLRRLSETSDAQLVARGTTRADEVRRIFGPALYI